MPPESSEADGAAPPCPHCGAVPEGYDALVAQLKREGAWGQLVVELKRGEVRLISLNVDYKTPQEALRRRAPGRQTAPVC